MRLSVVIHFLLGVGENGFQTLSLLSFNFLRELWREVANIMLNLRSSCNSKRFSIKYCVNHDDIYIHTRLRKSFCRTTVSIICCKRLLNVIQAVLSYANRWGTFIF